MNTAALELLADIALARGVPVVHDGYVVIPDVAALEGVANGYDDLPPTWQGIRHDSRSVRVYALPETVKQ